MQSLNNTRIQSKIMLNKDSLLFDNLIWLNTNEASEYLRISPANLRVKVHRSQLKSYKLNGRLRFKRSDLDELLESSLQGDFNGN